MPEIQYIKGFLTEEEIQKFQDIYDSEAWRFGWGHDLRFGAAPVWHIFMAGLRRKIRDCCEHELRDSERWNFAHEIWQRIKHHMPPVKLIGAYVNGHTAGQESIIHQDNRASEPGMTAILFTNPTWPIAWGGELMFYDRKNMEIAKAIAPSPGGLVVFDGRTSHQARSPSHGCPVLRTTVAFKTVLD